MVTRITAPADGLPPLRDTPASVAEVAGILARGHGPVAVDTERASSYRLDDRAFLIQLRRAGSGTVLIDPETVPRETRGLATVMNGLPWVLHAAHTDLPCLVSLGWRPAELHDTQIAGKLLGLGQVGLAGMLEEMLGVTVAKDHGRDDWSRRPLGTDLLTYAVLDVELLLDRHDEARRRLDEAGRAAWYRQECSAVLATAAHPVAVPGWRELKGVGALTSPRSLALVQRLWYVRTVAAVGADRPPATVLATSDIIAVASHPARARETLAAVLARPGRGRGRPDRKLTVFGTSLEEALHRAVDDALGEDPAFLPVPFRSRGTAVPDHRTWREEYPLAAEISDGFRACAEDVAGDLGIGVDTLIVMKTLRSAAWTCATGAREVLLRDARLRDPDVDPDPVGVLEDFVTSVLDQRGLRPWQCGLLAPGFVATVADAVGGDPGAGLD